MIGSKRVPSIPSTPKNDITQQIDSIFEHHYFHTKLQQLLDKKKSYIDQRSVVGLLDDQYYKQQDDIIQQIADIVNGVVETKLRDILTHEFINIGQQIEDMKQEMFAFMNQQVSKTEDIKKQLHKFAEQAKKRASTTQALSTTSVINTNGYSGGIRFHRSGLGAVTSTVQNGSTTTLTSENTKSFHSQLMALRKQFQQLKSNVDSGQCVKMIQDQLNQFRIETKVAVQALKQQTKKCSVDISSLSKSANTGSTVLAGNIKQHIQSCVRRTIAAQLKVYGTYSQQIIEIKQHIQQFEEKLARLSQTHNQYLSNQLKSVWLIINDMKKNLDDLVESVGLNSSREILM